MARVTVTVTARDLTGPQLARMRQNFNRLGQDMDRVLTQRTRQNFNRLQQSIGTTRRDLNALRGAIPDDEFFRLDQSIRRAQHRMQRGFRNTNLTAVQRDIQRVQQGFRDLDESARIRVRIDTSALRRADARLDAWRRQQDARIRAGQSAINRADRRLASGLRARTSAVRVRVDPDVNPHRFRRMATRSLTSPARTVGRLLGGTLSDGLGQGIANGFKGVGPLMGAALAIAIVAAMAVVGAALSGLLVTVLGAAFVGIGGVSAGMSKEVQAHWSKALVSMKKDFKSVGEPMIPVLQRGIDKIEEMSNKAAPKLKKAIEDTIPATNKFIDGLLAGFERFGSAAFGPIMDAWNVFAPVFGEEWGEFMDELGNSFGRMADLVREHPTEIAIALDLVFEAIDLLIDTITFLGKAWVFMAQNAGDAFGFILSGLAGLVGGVLDGVDAMLGGLETVAGFIGLDDSIKTARENLQGWRDDAVGKLQSAADAAYGWDDALNTANRKRTLEADISKWNAQIASAKKKLESVPKSKQAKLKADIAQLQAKVQAAKGQLASIKNKTVFVTVNTVYNTPRRTVEGGKGNAFAHGGIRGLSAAATGGVRSNMTMVGEQGPELVNLAPGSRVRSNPDTRRLMSQGGGGGGPIQANLVVSGKVLASVLIDPLRGEIRDRGGNVQSAIGVRGK